MRYFVLILAAGLAGSASAAEFAVYPPAVALTGPHSSAKLGAFQLSAGRATIPRNPSYRSKNPKIVTVDETGFVKPTGNGETAILVVHGPETIRVPVTVTKFETPNVWSFVNHIQPIFVRAGCNSGACHGALAGKGGLKLSLRGYDSDADHFALTRQSLGRRVDREEPAESLMLRKATRAMPHGGGTRFAADSDTASIVKNWIAQGAVGPKPDEIKLASIEVFPPRSLLKPKDAIRVSVFARYSDGTVSDVTRWAKYTSSEETVATVDEDGTVTVVGPGETAIAVLFGSRVVTATVTVPFANSVDDKSFAAVARNNFIDAPILGKLKLLRIPPSPDCGDEAFIRRAFLDSCGFLPKPAEVEMFLADKSADKRSKLIDSLLERPEFVDYWSHKWSDLLLVSTRKLSQQSVWGFHRQVRNSVADNQHWDSFARELLTASGSTLTSGTGGYFVLHKDVSDLTESTALTFLGTSITCARCHNHPLEKWTQDQYWQMANLFSRVGLKNGDRPGEILVQSLNTGDALHPRRSKAMPPTPLGGKSLPSESAQDRRSYFADWLTDPKNPFFAKAIVNRVWKNYMGRGLVEAEDDLRDTNPPTNAELLEALVNDFVEHQFDLKHLMKMILNSAAYQRSAKPVPGNADDDRFYSHYLLRRLTAEVIIDAYSEISGVPTPFGQLALGSSGGATESKLYPPGTRALQLPDSQLVSRFLDAFGRAERIQTCACEVGKDSSVTQALHLNNGPTLNDKLRDKNSVVVKWIAEKLGDEDIINRLFRTALGRKPTPAEIQKLLPALADARNESPAAHREAIEDVIWAVLTGKEFLFNH